MDSAGNLYGTTEYGGATPYGGTVFELPKGSATDAVLYSFTGTNGDGASPRAGLIMDSAGNLYGTTFQGGADNYGTVFELPKGSATDTVLYSFTGTNGDGFYPYAGLILDSAGNLYGTTYFGGANDYGTVFEVTPWGTETVLHSFTDTNGDGAYPYGGLILDSAGSLYGTTTYGGANVYGTVFELPKGSATDTVLYSFTDTNGDGRNPHGGLIMDSAGNFYGTTEQGGSVNGGIVFKLDAKGNETVLDSFPPTDGDGANPHGGLIMDSAGNFCGITEQGGSVTDGIVFKLDAKGNETVLDSFPGTNGDGFYPYAGLILDSAGNLYGTTRYGGADYYGTVFELPKGSATDTVLYSFTGTNGDGANPEAGLIMDSAGNLFGTTFNGGANDYGTVFEVTPSGTETILHSFGPSGIGEAGEPNGSLVMDSAGNLYGTTEDGGAHDYGTVFEVTPSGTETVLYSFTATNGDGAFPYAGLIMDSAGNLYGTTENGGADDYGTVFELPKGSATDIVLYSFTATNGDGAFPEAGLIMDSAGNLYGTTYNGGADDYGTVFELPKGSATDIVLYSFTATNGDGAFPEAGLIMDSAGNLYGTTASSRSGAEAGNMFELAAQLVSFSPNSLSFSSQAIGTTSPAQTVTLANSGIAALSISGISVSGTNAGDFGQTNNCGSGIAAGGNCTINVTFTPTGAGTRTASVSVADNATGSPQTIALTGVSPDLSIQTSALSPSSVPPGQSATSTITITSLNGLNSAVSLTCAVSPTPALAPTCALNPTSVTPAPNGSVSSTLTVSTTAATAAMRPSGLGSGAKLFYALWLPLPVVVVLVASLGYGSKKRRWAGLMLGLVLAAGLGFQLACGGNSSRGNSGTPAGSYTITVTASSGSSITYTTTLTLTVQ